MLLNLIHTYTSLKIEGCYELHVLSTRGSDQLSDTMNVRTLLLILDEKEETATYVALKLYLTLAMIDGCGICYPSRFNDRYRTRRLSDADHV